MRENNDIYYSIVMPNYNKSKYIESSIDSVLNQKYGKFELIVVDDGSTDDSIDIIKRFNDERVRLISQENNGASIARNTGIKNSKYGYVAFLDSDDFWCSDFLEEISVLIKEFPDCNAFGCAYSRLKSNSINNTKVDDNTGKHFVIENYFKWILDGNQGLTASSTVIKKCLFDDIGMFPPNVKNWEDLDMWARVGLNGCVAFTTNRCAIYREVDDSASKVNKTRLSAPFIENYKEIIQDDMIRLDRRKMFTEYVYSLKFEGAWQKYQIDQNGLSAISSIIDCFRTKRFRKQLIKSIVQYIITPDIYNFIRGNHEQDNKHEVHLE